MNRIIFVALLLFCTSLTSRAGQRDLIFVVPNEFHGFILLLQDAEKGVEIPDAAPTVTIPRSGILRVRSFKFIPKDWYTAIPQRADGTQIQTYFKPTLKASSTYFLDLGKNTPEDRMFFIGTGEECDSIRSNPFKPLEMKIEAMKTEAERTIEKKPNKP